MSRVLTPRARTSVSRLAAAAIVALLGGSVLGPKARADGDPASDILLSQNVFYPYGSPVSRSVQNTLNAEVALAGRAHFPIKVALIAAPTDLGVVPNLFDKPQKYADFLDQEIKFLVGREPLLVVMPNGYGVRWLSRRATLAAATLKKPAGAYGDALGRAAFMAVAELAAAAGHPIASLRPPPPASTSDHSATLSVALLALACGAAATVILMLRRRRARGHRRPGRST